MSEAWLLILLASWLTTLQKTRDGIRVWGAGFAKGGGNTCWKLRQGKNHPTGGSSGGPPGMVECWIMVLVECCSRARR